MRHNNTYIQTYSCCSCSAYVSLVSTCALSVLLHYKKKKNKYISCLNIFLLGSFVSCHSHTKIKYVVLVLLFSFCAHNLIVYMRVHLRGNTTHNSLFSYFCMMMTMMMVVDLWCYSVFICSKLSYMYFWVTVCRLVHIFILK